VLVRFLISLLCLLPMFAGAQTLRPNSGLWWEEPVTGRFYAVEIAPSGRTFVVISEFAADGKPVWRSMRGEIQVSSAQEQAAGAPLATLRAPLLELDGACPTCPVTAPNVRPSALGEATLVFQTHAQAEFQQGGTSRPLRYFTPADQPLDFPAARLPGDYTLVSRDPGGNTHQTTTLRVTQEPACVRYEGSTPPIAATRLRGDCSAGFCDSSGAGVLAYNLELAVGPGEHPQILAYQRALAPEAVTPEVCTLNFLTTTCVCPAGFTSGRLPTGGRTCIRNDRPMVCSETHRISEQAGVIRGLPVRAGATTFAMYPLQD